MVPRRSLRAVLVLAVAVAVVVLVAVVDSRQRRPSSPLPVASGVPGWAAGPPAPEALTEVAVAAHDGRIWVAGGYAADGSAVTTVQVFDPTAGEWSAGPSLPAPVHHSGLVSDGTDLWLVGGFAADGRPVERVLVLAAEGWAERALLPEARGAGAAAWDGARGRLIYAGGVGPDGVSDAVWAGNDTGWEVVGRLSEAREHLAAVFDGEASVFVLGGRRGGLTGNLGTADVVTGDEVRSLPGLPTPRGGVAAFWWPSLGACLVGGESPGGTHAEVECVQHDGAQARLPDLDRARHGLGAAVVGDRAYVVLGGERPGLFVSDAVEVLDLP